MNSYYSRASSSYKDTEGGFSKNRLREISKNTLNYINKKKKFENITSESLIENVKYIRIFDLEELINVLFMLPSVSSKQKYWKY